ncbi:MAG: hypothetical protein JKY86_14555, partial [Gammaproteobacteria bacterium]|nr:hypothetical protein [Gammaproteobacteria bacterium]
MAKSTKARSKKKPTKPYRMRDGSYEPTEQQVLAARVGWLGLGALWVFVLAGLMSFDAGD